MSGTTLPWWASAPEPPGTDEGPRAIEDVDPLEAFRTARRPRPAPPRAARAAVWPPDEPHPLPEVESELGADRGTGGGAPTEEPAGPAAHRPELCGICPLCTLARTLEETRPELLEHLTEAARHLAAAARTLLETVPSDTAAPTADRPARERGGTERPRGAVERIRLDPSTRRGHGADPAEQT